MNNNLKEGFSLIELLVYIAILTIILGLSWGAIAWMQKQSSSTNKYRKINIDAEIAIKKLSQSIENSSNVSFDNITQCLNVSNNIWFKFIPGNISKLNALYKFNSTATCAQANLTNANNLGQALSEFDFMIQSNPFETNSSISKNQTVVNLNIKIAENTKSNYTTVFYPVRTSKTIR
jgi:prepilin-type N-terminal cleavage/methylation domain-containing protein